MTPQTPTMVTGFRPACLQSIARAFLAAALILAAFPLAAFGENVQVTYDFDAPRLTPVEIEGQTFTRIMLPGAPNSGTVGSPGLPCRGARILIPYGEDVAEISVTASGKTMRQIEFPIEPVAPLYPLATDPADIPALVVDSAGIVSRYFAATGCWCSSCIRWITCRPRA